MQTRRRFRLLICAGLLTAALSGCGGSSSSDSIPSTVSIWYQHSVLLQDGNTYTMGYNGFGQLGDGTLTTREKATLVSGAEGMLKAVAGAEHTLAFGNNSSALSWGYNIYGQLGSSEVSTSYPDAYSSKPVKVHLHEIVVDAAAGGYHSLAIAGGKLYAWGYNGYKQIGDDTTTNRSTPLQITQGQESEDLTSLVPQQVAAGGLHSLALFTDLDGANSQVFAWGSNAYGQVGVGTDTTAVGRPKKVVIAGVEGEIEQVAALGNASLAREVRRDPDSHAKTAEILWGWGYNDSGELGSIAALLGHTEIPAQVLTVDVLAEGVEIKKMVNGTNHILLLVGAPGNDGSDGSYEIRAIGNNYYGELGDGTFTDSGSLVYVLQTIGGAAHFTGATDIAAFGTSSFAKVNGVWYAWGNNSMGQLGNTVDTEAGVPYFKVPVTVKF